MLRRKALIKRRKRCKRRLTHVRLGVARLEKTNNRRHMLALDGSLQLAQRTNCGLAHNAIEVAKARNELCFALRSLLILARRRLLASQLCLERVVLDLSDCECG